LNESILDDGVTLPGKHDSLEAFRKYREKMNRKILASGNLQIQRFFNLDTRAYQAGVLSSKTKELLGLVASLVLRCDDCITYHVVRCVEEGVSDAEFFEAFNVSLVVGGSITIPHLRRAVERVEECRTLNEQPTARTKRGAR
jgi:AhpD family alkylhydroperoxidase